MNQQNSINVPQNLPYPKPSKSKSAEPLFFENTSGFNSLNDWFDSTKFSIALETLSESKAFIEKEISVSKRSIFNDYTPVRVYNFKKFDSKLGQFVSDTFKLNTTFLGRVSFFYQGKIISKQTIIEMLIDSKVDI